MVAAKKYHTTVRMGSDPLTKKPIIKNIYADSKRELDLLKAQALIEREEKEQIKNSQTFGYYLDLYLEQKQREVSERYFRKCICSYANHLTPLRDIPIRDITAQEVQSILNDLAIENPTTGEQTSYNVLKEVRRTVSKVYLIAMEPGPGQAVSWDITNWVRIPKTKPPVKRMPIEDEQWRWIEETPHPCQTAAMIMLYAGLRRGEVTALTWDKVDLDEKTIRVNCTCIWPVSGAPEIKSTTKTKAGDRLISIPDVLVSHLSALPQRYVYLATNTNHLVNEGWWDGQTGTWGNYMTTLDMKYAGKNRKLKSTKNRKPKDSHVVRSKYDPFVRGKAISTFTPHMLRHTYCTMLYDAGVPVERAQVLMGHENLSTTMEIYTHLNRTHLKKDVEALNEKINKKSPSGGNQKDSEDNQ